YCGDLASNDFLDLLWRSGRRDFRSARVRVMDGGRRILVWLRHRCHRLRDGRLRQTLGRGFALGLFGAPLAPRIAHGPGPGIPLAERAGRIDPPVGGPEANNDPPQAAQDLLAQFVAVARRGAAVIGGAIALNTDQVASGGVGIDDAEVDAERGGTDLRLDVPA